MFGPKNVWQFTRNGPTDAEQLDITLSPQLSTPSFWMVRQACIDGLGIARMPSALCQYQVAQEQLQPLFPDWTMVFGNLTAIFPSRRMLSLPVRTFLDEVVNVIHQLPPTISLEDLENAWSSTEFIAPHSIRHLQ
jgi:DNA-binding transcriptional LysR family regulator